MTIAENSRIPFVGGIALTVLTQIRLLFAEPSTIMTHDLLKALAVGAIGAVGSGIGTVLWKYLYNKKIKKYFK